MPAQGKIAPLALDRAVFFSVLALFFWRYLDPRLVYHSLGVLRSYEPFSFRSDWGYFAQRLVQPGGAVEYLAALLSQLYAWDWAGALILTALAWSMAQCTDGLASRAGLPGAGILRYLPAVVLVVLSCHYGHPLRTALSVLASLAGFLLYARLGPESVVKRLALLVVLCPALVFLGGALGLLCPTLIVLDDLLLRRRFGSAAGALVVGAVLAGLVAMLPGSAAASELPWALVADPGILPSDWPWAAALVLFFPAVLVGAALVSYGRWNRAGRAAWLRGSRRRWVCTATALGIAAGAAWLSLDVHARSVLTIDSLSRSEDWDRLLEAADRMPRTPYDVRTNRNILLALQQTGRLGDDMFRYPQRAGVELFSTSSSMGDGGMLFLESRIFLTVGLVNHAETRAYDAVELVGELPAILEHLAVISLVKNQPESARLLLNAAARNPFPRTARRMLEQMREDPRFERDARVRMLRGIAARKDRVGYMAASATATHVETYLTQLLEENGRNKAAFDFLMAHYLASGRPEKIEENLGRLSDLGYPSVPRGFQEAVLVHRSTRPPQSPGVALAFDREVTRKAELLAAILQRSANKAVALEHALAAGLGDTYLFYLTFGLSGF